MIEVPEPSLVGLSLILTTYTIKTTLETFDRHRSRELKESSTTYQVSEKNTEPLHVYSNIWDRWRWYPVLWVNDRWSPFTRLRESRSVSPKGGYWRDHAGVVTRLWWERLRDQLKLGLVLLNEVARILQEYQITVAGSKSVRWKIIIKKFSAQLLPVAPLHNRGQNVDLPQHTEIKQQSK